MPGEGKTEKATPKKKSDQRKKGNVFQSKDMVLAASLLGSFYFLKWTLPSLYEKFRQLMILYLGEYSGTAEISAIQAQHLVSGAVIQVLELSAPVLIFSFLTGYLLYAVQTRFLFQISLAGFKFERINPIAGLQKMFTLRSLVELVKSLLKIIIIGWILYSGIRDKMAEVPILMTGDLPGSIVWICRAVFSIALRVGLALAVLGIMDFLYQWWEYERSMMMSKQEVKEEFKQLEGDPQIKSRIKERQRKMAFMRMMQKVPAADVVITNPTHYAVALVYEAEKSKAPVVIAKGANFLALKIIEVAKKNGVEVTENRPLARALYEAVDLEQEIPSEFYKAVAEVLAYVYRLKKKDMSRK